MPCCTPCWPLHRGPLSTLEPLISCLVSLPFCSLQVLWRPSLIPCGTSENPQHLLHADVWGRTASSWIWYQRRVVCGYLLVLKGKNHKPVGLFFLLY